MSCKTKVVCTIGPSVSSYEKIKELVLAGMNVARLNFSHGNHQQHREIIAHLKKAREELGKPLGIMLDTKGPEIRVCEIPNGSLKVDKGQVFTVGEPGKSSLPSIRIHPPQVIENLSQGTEVLFNDGYGRAIVEKLGEDFVELVAACSFEIKVGNGINIPSVKLGLPAMTAKDVEDISFACNEDLDFIAASFICSAEHVLAIRRLLIQMKKPDILIIAKIESAQGMAHFDDILQVVDGVMVARGDLGVELNLHQLPQIQKDIIRKCYLAGKPVLTATQMLESMIQHFRPTRAEVSDVANSIHDGTSAVMLSGETAVGAHPIEAVKVMKSIILEAEKAFEYEKFLSNYTHVRYKDIPSSLTVSAVKTSYNSGAKVIFAYTCSGTTVRLLSRLRPKASILTLTNNKKLYHQLSFNWGVEPFYCEDIPSVEKANEALTSIALEKSLLSYGDLVVVVTGSPFGMQGTTNTMIVQSVGDVVVRSYPGSGAKVSGLGSILLSSQDPINEKSELLILPRCNENYLPHLKNCRGVILDNLEHDTESEAYLKELAAKQGFSYVTKAMGATRLIKSGQPLTLDPEKGVVYRGICV